MMLPLLSGIIRIRPVTIKQDFVFLGLIVAILVGLPVGIRMYDRYLGQREMRPGTREFALTGNAQRGWLLGEVRANDILSWGPRDRTVTHPVIEVFKDDQVLLKLRSSDVTHGFSLKAFGIYVTNGIQPGRTVYVSFKADKVGRFLFSCNVYCGDIHQDMTGTLIVKERPAAPNENKGP